MDYNKANANGIFKVVIVENATHCQEKILKIQLCLLRCKWVLFWGLGNVYTEWFICRVLVYTENDIVETYSLCCKSMCLAKQIHIK